jgi:hypothetical protein
VGSSPVGSNQKPKDGKVKNGHYVKYNKHGLTEKDFDVTRTSRGINIQPGKNLQVSTIK